MVSRLEVVETGRRRSWSDAEKLRIVAESMAGHRQVSATARRHGIKRSQLNAWRRLVREGRLVAAAPTERAPAFAAVTVAPEAAAPAAPSAPSSPPSTPPGPSAGSDRVEVVLANGRRLVVSVAIDAAGLARLVAVLERA